MTTIPLSQIDAAFLHMETSRTPMHGGGLMVFRLPDKAPRTFLRELFAHMRSQPVTTPPFNLRLAHHGRAGIAPAWEPVEALNIDEHVSHVALPRPGGERELGELVARLHSELLDRARPLWECHLIEGLAHRRFAIYIKIHHAAADGMGALHHITRWLSPDRAHDNAPGPWANARGAERQRAQGAGDLPHHPDIWRRALELVKDQLRSASELTGMLIKMSRREDNPGGGIYSALEAPHSGFNAAVSAQRRVATQLFSLERFRRMSTATGASINDLSLAVLGAALRRYLIEQNTLPETTLVASIPVGLPRPDGKPGNTVTGFVCPLATEESSPKKRLERIHLVTSRTKQQLRSLSATALEQLALLGLSPLILGQLTGMATHLPPFFNLVVSNIVGPREKLYLRGAELQAMYPVSVLFDGHALNATIIGYADHLALGLVGCNQAVPHLQLIARYSGEAVDELEQSLGLAAATKPFHAQRKRGRPARQPVAS
jgi:WS/DGAT/MGAT family acyltransferase